VQSRDIPHTASLYFVHAHNQIESRQAALKPAARRSLSGRPRRSWGGATYKCRHDAGVSESNIRVEDCRQRIDAPVNILPDQCHLAQANAHAVPTSLRRAAARRCGRFPKGLSLSRYSAVVPPLC
jgi:hypothetical protein